MKRILTFTALLSMTVAALAGGRLEDIAITGEVDEESGLLIAETNGIFWDERCASVSYTFDTSQLPNALFGAPIPAADTLAELVESAAPWTDIPTSFIDLQVTSSGPGPGVRSFNFVNELTFDTPDGFTALASSPSVSLIADSTFAPGDDIDGDGDSDVFDPVAEGINVCADVDDDGDIEFPAGDYRAGTILDNDVQFGEEVFWSTEPGIGSADILAVSIHEFGHSHGLAHSAINQISDGDGTGSTMFPFIDTGDPASEIGQASLHTDDIAWSSFIYPEDTAASGLAALQPGDRAFNREFSIVAGNVTQADGLDVAGANVAAFEIFSGRTLVDNFSGAVRLLFDPVSGGLFLFRGDPATDVINGNYDLPVPIGLHGLRMQAYDGFPVPAGSVSLTALVGDILGLGGFPEEGIGSSRFESAFESRPGLSRPIFTFRNRILDATTNTQILIGLPDPIDFGGSGAVVGAEQVVYAQRFSNADVLPLLEADGVITTGLFTTVQFDASVVPSFENAALMTGRLNEDGTVDLGHTFQRQRHFAGQDDDATPLFFFAPRLTSRLLEFALRLDPTLDLFLVLETPDDFDTGPSGLPPFVQVDVDGAFGNSFLSTGGGPLAPIGLNWAIELAITP